MGGPFSIPTDDCAVGLVAGIEKAGEGLLAYA